MSKYLKKFLPFFILLILAFSTHFLFLSYPSEVVFDEVHFGKFVSAYFSHQYYFDIHPPLGKLMIAGFADIFGYKDNFDFSQIGEAFNAKSLFILRFLPAFFGSLFVTLIYGLILSLGFSKKSAFLAGFLVLFDNVYLVQSKFILVDIFLLFFGFASFYFFVLAEKSKNSFKKGLLFYIVSAISVGLSFSVKWTGLSFLGLILFFIFLNSLKQFKIKLFLQKIIIFTVLPFLVYLLVFVFHFGLLKNSGPGDAYMSSAFQKTLSGNQISADIKPLSFWGKFTELNIAMYRYNAGIKASHPNASKWYEWPLAKKPIWYWTKSSDGKTANIYLLGNPLVWWLVSLAVFSSLFIIFFGRFRKKISPLIYFLIFGYFLNLLPFILVSRVTFLYHYLPSLTFGILILVTLYEKLLNKLPLSLYLGFLIGVLVLFLLLSPLTYGFPTTPQTYQIYQDLFF